MKWARLAQRAFHRKVPAAKVGNRTEVGWWPHMKQDRDHTTSVKRRIKKPGKPAVVKANVKYDAWADPSLKALLGKAERCQTLMVDGLPDRDVCRSMDTLKRLWTKGLDKEPYTPDAALRSHHWTSPNSPWGIRHGTVESGPRSRMNIGGTSCGGTQCGRERPRGGAIGAAI